MNDIAYVVLSDLHFGAANSVLSDLVEGPPDQVRAVNDQSISPMLSGLLDSLEVLIDGNDGIRPTLILAGDILDLALSTDDVAAMVFEQFAKRAFGGARPLFADKVLYVPGNHDHHLWETARESQYVTYLTSLPATSPIEPAWHTTRMRADRDPQPVESSIVTALIRRQATIDVDVQVVYPNLALSDGNGDRCVVVHHGHFTESIYLLMSRLKDLLFPEQRTKGLPHVWEWEAENFAWIDFFWSTLGRSGGVGEDVGLIYAQLASPDCLHRYVDNLVRGLIEHEKAPRWAKKVETSILDSLVGWLIQRTASLERGSTAELLTAKGLQGLRDYIAGPVRDQLVTEYGELPNDVTFIFGHTHKPFEAKYDIAPYSNGVTVKNTGGWVVDTAAPAPLHGGAVILISSNLDVVSLRVYNQTADHAPDSVRLNGSGEWYDELIGKVRFDTEPWLWLSRTAAECVAQRNQLSAAYQRTS
jgi:hypothetical protein